MNIYIYIYIYIWFKSNFSVVLIGYTRGTKKILTVSNEDFAHNEVVIIKLHSSSVSEIFESYYFSHRQDLSISKNFVKTIFLSNKNS